MGKEFIKHFIAETAITEYCPVKYGSKEYTVTAAESANDCIIGVAQSNAEINAGVDVMLLGETFVNCKGVVDGTKPLVANNDGFAVQISDDTSGIVFPFARALEIDKTDAYLRCFVCPQMVVCSTKQETSDTTEEKSESQGE